ncbi:MAG: DUF3179 domain-containing protein [Gemmatimonadetes bacterium]|nr:DUF3179 domain-containing protein [Gemmatimonadota bacterium]
MSNLNADRLVVAKAAATNDVVGCTRTARRWLPLALSLIFGAACSDRGADVALQPQPTPGAPPVLDCSPQSKNVFDGGPGKDGIPALNRPHVVEAAAATFLRDEDRVLGFEVDGTARAYPLIVLWWHEAVNDTLGGTPVLVTYCPLTGSGLAFDPRIDGPPRSFGISGLLFENNMILFDRETNSLWNQLLLGAQCGPARGTELKRVPVVETTWGQWRAWHPQTTTVSTSTGHNRPYGEYPYGDYAQPNNEFRLFPGSPYSGAREPKELVLGVQDGAVSAAYPLEALRLRGLTVALNDTLNDRPIVVTYGAVHRSAWAFDRRLDDRTLTFSVPDPPSALLVDAETGSSWDLAGRAVSGPLQGRRLRPVADAYTLFWFAWSIFHPDTRLRT